MKAKINEIIEEFVWVSGIEPNEIAEKVYSIVYFDFVEYTNFINSNYKPFAGDWIRLSDDKIIYNPVEILSDFIKSRYEKTN